MTSKVDNFSFEFSGSDDQRSLFTSGDSGRRYYDNASPVRGIQGHFNDLPFYRQLLAEKGCRSVEIASVCVLVNRRYCYGIQAVYQITFQDGRKETREGPENFYTDGYYGSFTARSRKWMHLEDDEYFTSLIVNQGDILDGITFVTNRRKVHFGGNGGHTVELMVSDPSSTKIVAFCGTVDGICQRLGCYAIDIRWERLGTYILTRHLVNENRAKVAAAAGTKRLPSSPDFSLTIRELNKLDEGVFRKVMKFLA